MRKGEIIAWDRVGVWGVVEPDMPEEDKLYFHKSAYKGKREIEEGLKVSYQIEYNDIGQKYISSLSPIVVKDETTNPDEVEINPQMENVNFHAEDLDEKPKPPPDRVRKQGGEVREKYHEGYDLDSLDLEKLGERLFEEMTGKVLADKKDLVFIKEVLKSCKCNIENSLDKLNDWLGEEDGRN